MVVIVDASEWRRWRYRANLADSAAYRYRRTLHLHYTIAGIALCARLPCVRLLSYQPDNSIIVRDCLGNPCAAILSEFQVYLLQCYDFGEDGICELAGRPFCLLLLCCTTGAIRQYSQF